MMLSMATQILLGCIYFGSETAFNAFSSAGVIFLTVSYAIPIAASLFGGRKDITKGKFSLRKLGVFCNIVSPCMLPLLKPLLISSPPFSVLTICLGWSAFAIPLFCMPSYLPVTAETINYAFAVFADFLIIAVTWYSIWGHKGFQSLSLLFFQCRSWTGFCQWVR